MDEELQLAEIDSTLNDEVETEQPKQEVKNTSNVKKLLEQRNEARKKAAELEAKALKADDLEKRLAELEELIAGNAVKEDEAKQVNEFVGKNPDLASFKDKILEAKSKFNMSLDEARDFILAREKPELLVDPAYKARLTDNNGTLTGTPAIPKADINPKEMSADDFLKWSNEMAKGGGSKYF